ncbi:MAG: hypothetical protein RJB57_773 [Actinomycetota bacterium]
MAVSESRRHEMQLGLRRVLGDSVGETLMEHLPPVGWADVALTRDVMAVRGDINGVRNDMNGLRREIDGLRREIDGVRGDIDKVRSSVRFLVGAMITVSAAILVMLIQLNITVSQLQP